MTKATFFDKMQAVFGVSATELCAALIILAGVCVGSAVKLTRGETSPEIISLRAADNLYRALDSLAAVEKTTFTGVDATGNALPELARGDTISRGESAFPVSKKKELPSSRIDPNDATKAELMKLPGVGEATADNIMEYREKHKFRSLADIMNVKGIGRKKYDKMLNFIEIKK